MDRPKSQKLPRPKKAVRPNTKTKARADAVLERLGAAIPTPVCELDHKDAWTLLVATILSAQSTDKLVNTVTPKLFARWPTPRALASASQQDVEEVVHSTGFYRAKAKNLRETAKRVEEVYGGEVPRTSEQLVTLPGVARKTANVVLHTAYGIPNGFTVDTHAGRLSRRLELTEHDDPNKVEQDLIRLFEESTWIDQSHRLVLHGRYVCLARKPDCAQCPLNEVCPSREAEPIGEWKQRAARERRLVDSRGQDRGDDAAD